MNFEIKLKKIQDQLKKRKIDGWLFYDFRRSNDLACIMLEIPPQQLLTRRFFYWIPAQGNPVKIVSAIEEHALGHLPGEIRAFRTWQELEANVAEVLKKAKNIAMEYSPRNAIPYISKVDGGTLELVRSFGVDVVSSADLLQEFTSVWDAKKLETHLFAAEVLDHTAAKIWGRLSQALKAGKRITETEVQQWILDEFEINGCISSDPPICAVNAHSANPHFSPNKEDDSVIRRGDFVLIDLWCKKNTPGSAYADITRVAVADSRPTDEQAKVFSIVRQAQIAGTQLIEERLSSKQPIMGWEVDAACRKVITDAGYSEYFIHRTGHNIDETDHGSGAHIDNYETQDKRELIPGTCFSIEPGIYLPGKFGVRLEYDIFIHSNHRPQVTGGIQNQIVTLL